MCDYALHISWRIPMSLYREFVLLYIHSAGSDDTERLLILIVSYKLVNKSNPQKVAIVKVITSEV